MIEVWQSKCRQDYYTASVGITRANVHNVHVLAMSRISQNNKQINNLIGGGFGNAWGINLLGHAEWIKTRHLMAGIVDSYLLDNSGLESSY